jgi:hypothetical protein
VGDRRSESKGVDRPEYNGRLTDPLRQGPAAGAGVREYLLTDLDEETLAEAFRRPTHDRAIPQAPEVPFENYRFR